MNNDKKAIKSGIWYIISDFLLKSIGLITTPIFTRILSHAEYGIYNTFASWQSIFGIVAALQLGSSFISARYDFEDDFDSYILSCLSLGTISTIIFAIIVNCIYAPLAGVFSIDRRYINAIMIYLIFSLAVSMFQIRERYFFRYKASVAISLFIALGTASLSVLLVCALPKKLDGRIIGAILPTILLGFFLYIRMIKNGKSIKTAYWKYALPISIPYIPHLLSMSLLNSMDRIMITNYVGEEYTALYSVAYSCGALVTTLLTSMNTAFAPWLGEKLHQRKTQEIRDFAKKYMIMFALLAYGIILAAPEALLIIGGKSYMGALYVIPPVACGCIFQFVYTMYVNIEQFKKKTIGMALASISAAMLNFVLNAIFIPKYGFIAAAYTTLAGYCWLTTAHMFIVYKIGEFNNYDHKFVIFGLAASILVAVAINFLYSIPVIRWIVICVYAAVIVTILIQHKNEIMLFFRKEQ